MPGISFAVPHYRGEAFLLRAVHSVRAQTFTDWELLISDDGGDAVGPAAALDALHDPRIRYERNPQTLGMAGNWNRCLDRASSDLVNLLHADDELLPNYAETMVHTATAEPNVAAWFCRAAIIDGAGQPCFSLADRVKRYLEPRSAETIRLAGATGFEALCHGDFIMCPTVCYRKSRLGRERFDARWKFVLDLEFFTRLLLQNQAIVGLPITAYAYRRHPENATALYTETLLRFEEESALHDRLTEQATARGWSAAARAARAKRMLKLHLLYRILHDASRGRFSAAQTKWRFLRHGLTPQKERPCPT